MSCRTTDEAPILMVRRSAAVLPVTEMRAVFDTRAPRHWDPFNMIFPPEPTESVADSPASATIKLWASMPQVAAKVGRATIAAAMNASAAIDRCIIVGRIGSSDERLDRKSVV